MTLLKDPMASLSPPKIKRSLNLILSLRLSPLLIEEAIVLAMAAAFMMQHSPNSEIKKKIIAIGLAYALQEIDQVPIEPHDQRLDYLITEREIITFA